MDVRLLLFCIVFYGFATFFRKLAVDQIHPFQFEIFSGAFHAAFIPLFVYLAGRQGPIQPAPLSAMGWTFLCTVFHISAAIAFGFMIRGSNNTGVITALVSLSPIVTLALSTTFLGETFFFFLIVAFALALLSAIIVNF